MSSSLGVPALWQATEVLPGGVELLTRLLTYLDATSIVKLLHVEKRTRNNVRKLFTTFQNVRGRLAMAALCKSRLRVEFQSYYQVLETQSIPRSNDPRVPPRVVSIWTERGQVDGGLIALSPVDLPSVHKNGVTARFVADVDAAGKRPMLTNVVQRNRRIYTMVTVKLLRTGDVDGEEGTGDGLVLRSYSYLKDFGEWKTLTLLEKRMLATASAGSRRGRFDLVSQDGSVVLELEVPTGTDAQTDYYLVKQVAVSIHLQELLQLHFQSLRPIQPLPAPAVRQACAISIVFRSIAGDLVTRCSVPGFIVVERQGDETAVEGSAEPNRPIQRTGVEKFDIVTCQADYSSSQSAKVALLNAPGYAWLEVRSRDEGVSLKRSKLYFYAVALHYGAQRVPERGDLQVLQFNWLPGVLESFPTLESRRRRCLKGSVRIVASSNDGKLQELTLVAQRLSASRLERYAASVESYTRHEA